jgi:hypothetical protein
VPERRYSLEELQDRAAIADLYDRQLAAAEAWDLEAYDTTFSADAEIDLRDFGQGRLRYPDYRSWLASLRTIMVSAQRLTGGLRLELDGATATTRVPTACFVTMEIDGTRSLISTGIFYNDSLHRTSDGWRITERYEELSWSGTP